MNKILLFTQCALLSSIVLTGDVKIKWKQCRYKITPITPDSCCHSLIFFFFASLTRSELFNVLHFVSVSRLGCQLSALLLFCFCNIVLWLQLHPLPHPLLFLSLFSPLSSDSNGLSECSCDSVALRQKVAALWMWGKQKRKRLLPDCPGTKKRHFFHFLPGLWEKKTQEDGKECWGRGWGNCWAQCKEVKLFSLETCLKGWAEAWKVSQRKFSTT